jgi:peptide/nickel transport system ATP-binding protein
MQTPLLEVKDLTKIYRSGLIKRSKTVALEGFSFTMPSDDPRVVTIAGESGSGKSTLVNLILGFLSPTSGQILHDGKDLWAMSREERLIFRKEVQGIFQDPYGTYNPFYVVDHVMHTTIRKFGLAESKEQAREITEEGLRAVGLRPDEVLGKHPHQLSGGQRQRIMVARALLTRPRLVVADEPVSMVDASLQVRILNILRRMKDEFGISLLYITHDLATAYQISDEIYVLYLGSVMESGDIDAVMQNPKHPYTQLLVRSIPVPDPRVRWEEHLDLSSEEEVRVDIGGGCLYYKRCPHPMDVCRNTDAPVAQVEENHYVRCRFYGEG